MVSVHKPAVFAFVATMLVLLILVVLSSFTASGDVSDLGVEVQAEETSGESGEPGDLLSYDMRVKNTGTVKAPYLYCIHSHVFI